MTASQRAPQHVLVAMAFLVALAFCSACSDEDGPIVLPGTGTILVSASPEWATWSLLGPGGISHSGEGMMALADMPPGGYELRCDDVIGYTTPAVEQFTLATGEVEDVHRSYAERLAQDPDEAVALCWSVYEHRHFDRYTSLHGDGYLFIQQDGGPQDAVVDSAIMGRMFHEVAGRDGVSFDAIAVVEVQPLGDWEAAADDEPDLGPGGLKRTYSVQIDHHVTDSDLVVRAQGPVVIHVIDQGTEHPDWRVRGFRDATSGAEAAGNATWSAVRNRFLPRDDRSGRRTAG
jgi:hypothetical protein